VYAHDESAQPLALSSFAHFLASEIDPQVRPAPQHNLVSRFGAADLKKQTYETSNNGHRAPTFYVVSRGGEATLLLTIDKVAEYLGLKKSAMYDWWVGFDPSRRKS